MHCTVNFQEFLNHSDSCMIINLLNITKLAAFK